LRASRIPTSARGPRYIGMISTVSAHSWSETEWHQRGSNSHVLADSRVWAWRVYLFRHGAVCRSLLSRRVMGGLAPPHHGRGGGGGAGRGSRPPAHCFSIRRATQPKQSMAGSHPKPGRPGYGFRDRSTRQPFPPSTQNRPGRIRTTATRFRRPLLCPLSYGFGLLDGSRTRLRETGRNRTGTHPGHSRALCPVKLQPPCLSHGGLARSRTSISGISPRRSSA
jgi:hypothetical protein